MNPLAKEYMKQGRDVLLYNEDGGYRLWWGHHYGDNLEAITSLAQSPLIEDFLEAVSLLRTAAEFKLSAQWSERVREFLGRIGIKESWVS